MVPTNSASPSGASLRADRLRQGLVWPVAGLTGVLLILAFPRYGLDFLIWFTLVPLYWAASGSGARRGFLAGWLAGLTLECGGFLWILYAMREFTGLGRWALILFLPWLLFESIPWGLLGLFLGVLGGRGRRAAKGAAGSTGPIQASGWIFAVIPLWVGIEQFYPRLFPWQVGGALHERIWLVQCVDLLGAGGLTALVLLVNTVIHLVFAWSRGRAAFPARSLILALVLLGAANLYGSIRLGQVGAALAGAPELKVGIIQPVTQLPEKEEMGNVSVLFDKMKALTRALAQQGPVDLMVWPEGACPVGFIFKPDGRIHATVISRGQETGFEEIERPLVAGSWSSHEDEAAVAQGKNTAIYIVPGKWPPGFYHKNVLMPFGETIPFWDLVPEGIKKHFPFIGSLLAGTDSPLFDLASGGGPFRFRVLICYEAVLPGFLRSVASGADFLVNVTEDIWYGNTSHIGQHVSVLRLRAVENRIPIVRSANVGPSGILDPTGAFQGRMEPYGKAERIVPLKLPRLFSFYRSFGWTFPGSCIAGGLLLLWISRHKK